MTALCIGKILDSPKHLSCLNKGLTGQYYRMVGSNNYKCRSCGLVANSAEFEPEAFKWRDEPDTWKVWADKNISDAAKKLSKRIVDEVKLHTSRRPSAK